MSKLAIIGAGYLQLPLVHKAKSLGIETHCFAWEEGAVCCQVADYFYPISITEKEQILSICQKVRIDGIITIASDLAVTTVNYVAQQMGLVGNQDAYTLLMTNKFFMREQFTSLGVSSPKYKICRELFCDVVDLKFPLITKPTDRSGSVGVTKVNSAMELTNALKEAINNSFSQTAIVEEFIEGREVSVECISWKGHHYLLAITDKTTTSAPHFVEIAHTQPAKLSVELTKKIEQLVMKVLDALHIENGASHTEIKITDNEELFVIEVGARMGGDFIGSHLVHLSTGYDFLQAAIELSLGTFTPPNLDKEEKYIAEVYFLSQETSWLKPIIENRENYPEIVEAKILNKNLTTLRSSSDRSGYLICKGQFQHLKKELEQKKCTFMH